MADLKFKKVSEFNTLEAEGFFAFGINSLKQNGKVNIGAIKQLAAEAETVANNADTRVTAMETSLQSMAQTVSSLNTSVEQLSTSVSSIESSIPVIEQKSNTALQNSVEAKDIANATTTTVSEAITTIDSKLLVVDQALEQVDTSIAAANTAATNANEKAQLAETATTTANTAAVQIQEHIEYLDYFKFVAYAYGVEFDTGVSNPSCIRIGNYDKHRTLPIHNKMKGCLLNANGDIVKYLNTNDWTSEVRDGSQGNVLVEIPEHYRKFETSGTKRRIYLSEVALNGFHFVPKRYVSAYEASLQRSTNKLASVVNLTEDYRGGNGDTTLDLLGRAVTNKSLTELRTCARNIKPGSFEWNCFVYSIWRDLCWLFVTEYSTLNCQLDFNPQLTSEGFKQGGLGLGMTNLASSTAWDNYNGMNPIVPCGYTDNVGNGTTSKAYQINAELSTQVPRYRGIENPFGHIFKLVDGLNIKSQNQTFTAYTCDNPALFNSVNYDGYTAHDPAALPSGFIKSVLFGDSGEVLPKDIGGSNTSYFCDYFVSVNDANETLRVFGSGGNAMGGLSNGLFSGRASFTSNYAINWLGTRLCFIPQN